MDKESLNNLHISKWQSSQLFAFKSLDMGLFNYFLYLPCYTIVKAVDKWPLVNIILQYIKC